MKDSADKLSIFRKEKLKAAFEILRPKNRT